jgi:small subunit ribosomal protein S12
LYNIKKKPQARGRVLKNLVLNPRKPNSAVRKALKLNLFNKKFNISKVPGSGKLPTKHAVVLFRGGGFRDTPNVNFTVIRGALECLPLFEKLRKRSLFGTPKSNKLYKSKRSLVR